MESKPHRVEVQDHTVTKYFGDVAMFSRELFAYELGLPMLPRLMSYAEPEKIVLERIEGEPYLDRSFGPGEASRLAETIAAFHISTLENAKCLCHWDNQPRNVINAGDSFYLIDFAESRVSYPEDDVTHLMLFWASEFTSPELERLARVFIAKYSQTVALDPERWKTSFDHSLGRFDKRRSLHSHASAHMDLRPMMENREIIGDLLTRE